MGKEGGYGGGGGGGDEDAGRQALITADHAALCPHRTHKTVTGVMESPLSSVTVWGRGFQLLCVHIAHMETVWSWNQHSTL